MPGRSPDRDDRDSSKSEIFSRPIESSALMQGCSPDRSTRASPSMSMLATLALMSLALWIPRRKSGTIPASRLTGSERFPYSPSAIETSESSERRQLSPRLFSSSRSSPKARVSDASAPSARTESTVQKIFSGMPCLGIYRPPSLISFIRNVPETESDMSEYVTRGPPPRMTLPTETGGMDRVVSASSSFSSVRRMFQFAVSSP